MRCPPALLPKGKRLLQTVDAWAPQSPTEGPSPPCSQSAVCSTPDTECSARSAASRGDGRGVRHCWGGTNWGDQVQSWKWCTKSSSLRFPTVSTKASKNKMTLNCKSLDTMLIKLDYFM